MSKLSESIKKILLQNNTKTKEFVADHYSGLSHEHPDIVEKIENIKERTALGRELDYGMFTFNGFNGFTKVNGTINLSSNGGSIILKRGEFTPSIYL